MPTLGPTELIVILVIVLVLFGVGRIGRIGGELGKAIREFRSLPLTLRNRGYNTALVGKWHLGQFKEPSNGFQHWVAYPKGHTTDFYNNRVVDNGKEYEVKDRHLVDFWVPERM